MAKHFLVLGTYSPFFQSFSNNQLSATPSVVAPLSGNSRTTTTHVFPILLTQLAKMESEFLTPDPPVLFGEVVGAFVFVDIPLASSRDLVFLKN